MQQPALVFVGVPGPYGMGESMNSYWNDRGALVVHRFLSSFIFYRIYRTPDEEHPLKSLMFPSVHLGELAIKTPFELLCTSA